VFDSRYTGTDKVSVSSNTRYTGTDRVMVSFHFRRTGSDRLIVCCDSWCRDLID